MAEYVHSGEKILASQYNALVDAVAGPQNATTDQPFTQTRNGVVINNGRNTTQTQPDPVTEPLFNISYGVDILPVWFEGDGDYFDGIWVKLTSWDKLDNICYHTYMLGWPVYLFLIDDTASSGKLIWTGGQMANDSNLLLPICKISESAGVATFTIKNESASASLLQQMQTIVVIGNFEKLGCQQGESAIDINKDSLTNLVRTACPILNGITGLALRDSRPLYVAPDEDFATNAQPVTYKVGQIQCETLPDSFQGPMGWVGYDIHLSSLAFTPSKQIGANNPTIPTFSYELFNFDKYPADLSTYYDLSSNGLSCYDVLVKHKKKHPYADVHQIYKNQAEADLEYVSLSCLVPPGDTNANKDSTINTGLSSVELATIDGNAFYELYGFQRNGTLSPSDLSSGGIEVVVRDSHSTGGNGARVNYVDLSTITESLSALAQISGDTNLSSLHQKSIETKDDSSGTYHQLYGFDSPTIIPESSLSSGGYQVVLRDANNSDKRVVYSEVSSIVGSYSDISGDVNVVPSTEKSIETVSSDSGKFHRLYNWVGYSADQSHVISAAFGETMYFPFQDGVGVATDLANAAHILTRPRVGTKELHYDAYGIKLPKVSPTDITQELYDLILSGGGTDISAVRQIVIDTLDDADAKGPLSSNLNDCFWPQGGNNSNCWGSGIGDSQKRKVIDLDGNTLYAVGNNQSVVDWAGDVCYDSQGTQSILWDGRGLIDSGSQWALDWENRQCFDSTATPTVDWENGALKVPASGNNSVDWKSGVLYDPNNGNESLNWDVGYAQDPTGSGVTVNWNTGQLWSDNNTRTLNWKNRVLEGNWRTNGNFTVGGNGSTLTIGSTTLTEAQLQQLLRLI